MIPHTPVLLDECLDALQLKNHGCYLDATFGRGGHSRALLEQAPGATLFVCDRDKAALDTLQHWATPPQKAWHDNYSSIDTYCDLESLDGILADLGVCSTQIDEAERGFSFTHSGPLDMRMDRSQDLTLEKLLRTTNETDLANIIYRYGQERHSRRVAQKICQEFSAGKLRTTAELATLISRVVKQSKLEKKHPATRTFQALRIAVNQEFEHLERFLDKAPLCLKNGGRLVVITFHSLEYQIVKEHFLDDLKKSLWETKGFKMVKVLHPLFPSALEQAANPRSRSARLHVYERQIV